MKEKKFGSCLFFPNSKELRALHSSKCSFCGVTFKRHEKMNPNQRGRKTPASPLTGLRFPILFC